ncbi:hypothetical protein CC79DRAFT_754748 [Sarocladium strictum]
MLFRGRRRPLFFGIRLMVSPRNRERHDAFDYVRVCHSVMARIRPRSACRWRATYLSAYTGTGMQVIRRHCHCDVMSAEESFDTLIDLNDRCLLLGIGQRMTGDSTYTVGGVQVYNLQSAPTVWSSKIRRSTFTYSQRFSHMHTL